MGVAVAVPVGATVAVAVSVGATVAVTVSVGATVAVAVSVGATVAVTVSVGATVAVAVPVTTNASVSVSVSGGCDGSCQSRQAWHCRRAHARRSVATTAADVTRIDLTGANCDARRPPRLVGRPNRILDCSASRRAGRRCRSAGETMSNLLEIQPDLAERGRYPDHTRPSGSAARGPLRLERGSEVADRANRLPVRGAARGSEPRLRNHDPFDRRGARLALLDRIERARSAQGKT